MDGPRSGRGVAAAGAVLLFRILAALPPPGAVATSSQRGTAAHTTTDVPIPALPTAVYPSGLRHDQLIGPVPSPYAEDPSRETNVLHVAVTGDPCGAVPLIAPAPLDHVLYEAEAVGSDERKNGGNRILTAWFYMGVGCAQTIYTAEYFHCGLGWDVRNCTMRTPGFWSDWWSSFAYATPDGLGLVMVAPPASTSGTYRRYLSYNGHARYTDFLVRRGPAPAPCWFSLLTHSKYPLTKCYTEAEYRAGIDRGTWLWWAYPGEIVAVQVQYRYARYGGKVPAVLPEARPYADSADEETPFDGARHGGFVDEAVLDNVDGDAGDPLGPAVRAFNALAAAGDGAGTAPPAHASSSGSAARTAGGVVAGALLTALLAAGLIYCWRRRRAHAAGYSKLPRPARKSRGNSFRYSALP